MVLCRMSRIPRHGGWGMVQNWFTVFSNKLDPPKVTCAKSSVFPRVAKLRRNRAGGGKGQGLRLLFVRG